MTAKKREAEVKANKKVKSDKQYKTALINESNPACELGLRRAVVVK